MDPIRHLSRAVWVHTGSVCHAVQSFRRVAPSLDDHTHTVGVAVCGAALVVPGPLVGEMDLLAVDLVPCPECRAALLRAAGRIAASA